MKGLSESYRKKVGCVGGEIKIYRRIRSCGSSYRGSERVVLHVGAPQARRRRWLRNARHFAPPPDSQLRQLLQGFGTRGASCRSAGKARSAAMARGTRFAAPPDSHCGSSYRGRKRGASCRSAGRREGRVWLAERASFSHRPIRSCGSSYRGSGTRGGSCRSAGRRERGGGVRNARHLPHRPIRSCRSSYREPGTRGGLCRSAGRRERGGGVRNARHFPHPRSPLPQLLQEARNAWRF